MACRAPDVAAMWNKEKGIPMRSQYLGIAAALLIMLPPSVHAAVDRVSDKELSAVVKALGNKAENFIDAVDSKLKNSIVRGATGEKDFGLFLGDFDKSIEKLRKRYSKTYAASEEASDVIRRGSELEAFVKSQPGMKGEKQWVALSADLSRVALAYGTDYPADPTRIVPARRVGDGELLAAADVIAKSSTTAAGAAAKISKDKKATDAQRTSATAFVRSSELMKPSLEALKRRVSKGESALAEAQQVVGAMTDMTSAATNLPFSKKTAEAWEKAGPAAGKLALAYRIEPVAQPPN